MSDTKPPVPGPDDPDHEFQDAEISRLYQKLPHPRPTAETDAEILTVARRVVDAPRLSGYFGWRSGALATAAVLVLMVGLLRFWGSHGRRMEEAPMAEATVAAPAAAPVAAEPSATPAPAPFVPVPAPAAAPTIAQARAAKATPDNDINTLAAPGESQADVDESPEPAMKAKAASKLAPRLASNATPSPAAAPASAAAPAPAAAGAPIVDSAVEGAILQHQPGVHELMAQGRYDAAYNRAGTSSGSGPWDRLDSDLLGLLTGKPTAAHCANNTADSVVNDACTLLHSYREGKTLDPEDVKAMGIAIKRYAPEHQYWFNGLQDLLKR